MDDIEKFKWLFFIIYLVLMVAFIEVAQPSLIVMVILFGIVISVSLYIMADDRSKIKRREN